MITRIDNQHQHYHLPYSGGDCSTPYWTSADRRLPNSSAASMQPQRERSSALSTSSTSSSNASGGGGAQACAACKFQRRKCSPECPLAPYFPPDQPKQFLNVHKLYGVSNTLRILKQVHPSKRNDAMKSILYEADARDRDPVHGCFGIITFLHTQAQLLREELDFVRTQIHLLDQQQQQQQQSLQAQSHCGSFNILNPAAHHFLTSSPTSATHMNAITSAGGLNMNNACNSPVSSPDSYNHPYHHPTHGILQQYASPPSADSYGGGGQYHHVQHGSNNSNNNSADSYVMVQPLCLQSSSPVSQTSSWQAQQLLSSSQVNWLAYQYMQQQQQQQQQGNSGAGPGVAVDATSALLLGMARPRSPDHHLAGASTSVSALSMKPSNLDVRPSFDTRSLADLEPLQQHSYHDSAAPKNEAAYESSAESSIKDHEHHSLEHDELQSAAALFALTSGSTHEQ